MPTQFPKTSDQFVYPAKGRKTVNFGLHPSPYSLHRVVFRRIGGKKEKMNPRKPLQISLYLPAGVNTRVIQYNGKVLSANLWRSCVRNKIKESESPCFDFFQ